VNVLLFYTDQQRCDSLGCYGNPVIDTPNVDLLAAQGLRFDRAYVQNPVCMPSRVSLLTGLHPRDHGVWTNGVPFCLGAETLPAFLGEHGYATAAVGKLHLNPFGEAPEPYVRESRPWWAEHPEMKDWHGPYLGFQEVELVTGHVSYASGHYRHYLEQVFPQGIELLRKESALPPHTDAASTWKNAIPAEHHYNRWIADKTKGMLRKLRDRPFFIQCSFPDPHFPFSAPQPYCDLYSPADVLSPIPAEDASRRDEPPHFELFRELYAKGQTERHFREMAAQTYGMVRFVDECVGEVMEELGRLGLRDDTLVIFTSDHGELLGDHGLIYKGPYLFQPLVRTPFILSCPSRFAGGRACSSLAGQVDLFPTVAEFLGVAPPAYLPGRSLAPVLAGDSSSVRDAVLTEFHCSYPQLGLPFNLKALHTDRWKYVHYANHPTGELYDLHNDPDERRNLFNDPQHRQTRQDLQTRLLDELVRTEADWPTTTGNA